MRVLILALTLAAALSACKKPEAPPAPPALPKAKAVAPAQALVKHEPDTLLGGELGLDHIGVAVRDLELAQRVYGETLGFGAPQAGTLPNGLKNVNYYFADGGYIELMTFWDKEKADWLAAVLEKTEGANFVLLSVFDIEETRAFLEKRSFAMGTTMPGRIDKPGAPAGTEALWSTLFFKPPLPLPGGRVGFIAYRRDQREKSLEQIARTRLAKRSPHANTAKRMQAIWMLVRDLEAARKAYGEAGLPERRQYDDPRLGAKVQELSAGQGTILLVQPTDPKGQAARFLERRGECLAGVSIEVLSLEKSHELLRKRTGQELPRYDGPYGKSFLLPPELTFDLWMEMYEP
ncbi:MAG: VOC family protein [Deltaproteobacteria bacterium]|nr:VOC family protein [Deltaproteobacteria bacterium]